MIRLNKKREFIMSSLSNPRQLVPVEDDNTSPTENVDITTENGRTKIVFRKAVLKGKVTSSDVLNTILIAARMQAEKYIEKLSRGAPLDVGEVKALKELADITKLEVQQPTKPDNVVNAETMDTVKNSLYQALTDRLSNDPK